MFGICWRFGYILCVQVNEGETVWNMRVEFDDLWSETSAKKKNRSEACGIVAVGSLDSLPASR